MLLSVFIILICTLNAHGRSLNMHSNTNIKASLIETPENLKEDIFSNTDDSQKNNVKFYTVKNYNEIQEDYSYVLDDNTMNDIIFYLVDTRSFLTRKMNVSDFSEDKEVQNIDDIGAAETSISKKRNTFKKDNKNVQEEIDEENEWIEYTYEDVDDDKYPGYIPISPCLSQEYGESGFVTFSYSFSQESNIQRTFSSTFGIPFAVFSSSIALSLEVAIKKTTTTQGQIQCPINAGTIGQVLLKPTYISCIPKKRKIRWLNKARRFAMSSKFRRYDRVFLLLENNFFQIDCATSDVVDLFCDYDLGVEDWESPLGIGYEDVIYEKEISKIL